MIGSINIGDTISFKDRKAGSVESGVVVSAMSVYGYVSVSIMGTENRASELGDVIEGDILRVVSKGREIKTCHDERVLIKSWVSSKADFYGTTKEAHVNSDGLLVSVRVEGCEYPDGEVVSISNPLSFVVPAIRLVTLPTKPCPMDETIFQTLWSQSQD